MEIERKFLLAELPARLPIASSATLRQGYLATGAAGEVRLREADDVRTLTVKSGVGLVREEAEIAISAEQFEALWPATEGRRIEKRRHRVDLGGVTCEVDVYTGALAGLIVAEVEFAGLIDAEAFSPPVWFGPELTGDERYSNGSLAVNGRPGRAESGDGYPLS